ncbi:endonuclease/exonuclease/phosphatase family protein [Prevotella ihumii]|uniref:endonuclease/exonuclease/phosphatase family protein n=1 Tax=Prevotella ihumii TaxID=1917878 RepID=UPI000980F277|nr:endonuclease/exonuclease/phosphatase family protein [Prevotella ihumii]
MFRTLKSTAYWALVVSNGVAIILMFLVGNIDKLSPVEHPLLSNIPLGFPLLLALNLGFLVLWTVVRFRMVWLPIVGLLLCYGSIRIYTPFNLTAKHPAKSLKVLTYNVFLFNTWDYLDSKENPILRYILDSKADIVCLQETQAYYEGGAGIYDTLKAAYPYSDNIRTWQTGDQHMMFLSKYKILKKERIKYASQGNISMAYIINYNGREVLVVNNHFESNHLSEEDKHEYKRMITKPFEGDAVKKESFSLLHKLGEASKVRAPQVDAVTSYVKKYRERNVPVILCGDFNDNPLSYTRRKIAEQLTDCYIKTGNGPGFSYHKSGMFVRIDNIFCSDEFEPFEAKVDNKVNASDHYPLLTWLKYRPKP